MSEFHSTVSRRDFMKGLGLTGVGLGAASLAVPAFHDLDEVSSSTTASWNRPWYVKQIDAPTLEVNWEELKRFDTRDGKAIEPDEAAKLTSEQMARWDEATRANKPGYRMRDRSLSQASWLYAAGPLTYDSFTGPTMNAMFFREFESEKRWATLPKWESTPVENSRTLRAALKHFGAYQVSFLPLDDNMKKLIYSYSLAPDRSLSRPVVFEDVEKAYHSNDKYVIPNKCKWIINYTVLQSNELSKRTVAPIGTASFGKGYSDLAIMEGFTQQFLKGLGYQGVGGSTSTSIPVAFGICSGLGESSRASFLISPEYGATVRQTTNIFTDLPLEPTKPIDAGIFRFCRTCKKCADSCPSNSINKDSEPSWDCVTGKWNNSGIRGFKNNFSSCLKYWYQGDEIGCGICQGSCVYSKTEENAMIHEIVKGTISQTSLFNGFFRNMDDVFGYGMKPDLDAWWNEDRPGNLRRF
ncbi:reductive dehalogenase [Dehalogenimonas etheniformans]|nr:reductive dehalogenase [Dehalogenimonas etheniformans]